MLASAGVDLERQLEDENVNLLGVVLGLLALLELVDRLAVARGGREHLPANGDFGLAAGSSIEASIRRRSVRSMKAWAGEEVR